MPPLPDPDRPAAFAKAASVPKPPEVFPYLYGDPPRGGFVLDDPLLERHQRRAAPGESAAVRQRATDRANALLAPSRGRCRGPGRDCVVVQKPPKRGRMSDRCPFCGRVEWSWREMH
jgi:hypothetical protein